MTTARVTDTEFLIYFSYADRDRAKRIRNYRWNPIEKVWHYPLTKRTYNEILREFDKEELEFTGEVSRLAEWTSSLQEDAKLDALFAQGPVEDKDVPGMGDYLLVCRLYEMVTNQGFEVKSDVELLNFLEECVSQRASDAEVDARWVIQNAQLAATRAELDRLKMEHGFDSANIEKKLMDAVWGGAEIPRPDLLSSFRFDTDGVIKITEWVTRSLRSILRKAPNESLPLFELVREAYDAQIISKDAYRLCETLRHQRNRFGHDGVNPNGALQHALLALTAFSLVYRELYPKLL